MRGGEIDLTPPKPLRTLYLMHGVYGSCLDWLCNSRIKNIAEACNLCVIMPDGENSFYNDHIDGARFGTFIGEELVAITRRLFNLSTRREDTAIGGLSMGGYGATVNALRHPDTFVAVIGLSSAFMLDSPVVLNSTAGGAELMHNRDYYDAVFGTVSDVRGTANDYDALAECVAAGNGFRPRFYYACGEADPLCASNRKFAKRLVNLGFDCTFVASGGGHSWEFWANAIEPALKWLLA